MKRITRKTFTLIAALILCAYHFAAAADTFGTGANQFIIDFVPISGDAGNLGSWSAGDGYTFSGVNHGDYCMGKYEITNAQWNKFKAAYGTVTGTPSTAYDSNPYSFTGSNVPTNSVSWYEAAQFVNYLNTSTNHQAAYKFTGTPGTSGYTLGTWNASDTGYNAANPYRNSNAFYFLPTENEWVKAAYWNGTSLQTYATIGDTVPVAGIDTNYNNAITQPWNVGSGSQELNGTFNMMGNVLEWIESPYFAGDYLSGSYRSIRGGSYGPTGNYLRSSYHNIYVPYYEDGNLGFRVASVPEPATLLLLSLGGLLIRRKK